MEITYEEFTNKLRELGILSCALIDIDENELDESVIKYMSASRLYLTDIKLKILEGEDLTEDEIQIAKYGYKVRNKK